MKLLYNRLCEVVVRHDYLMTGLTGNLTDWPEEYDIQQEMEFIPSPECQQVMKNHRLRFRTTPLGFEIWTQVEDSAQSVGDKQTFMYLDPSVKLTFYIKIKNPSFVNYTNLRINGSDNVIYYFNNRTNNVHQNISFLSLPLPFFPTQYPGETQYLLGDVIRHSTTMWEAEENVTSAGPPHINTSQWQQLFVQDARYVTPQDRLAIQGSAFTYSRSNPTPGEIITFRLFDLLGNEQSLGNIPNTTQPQGSYQTSLNGYDVYHTIDFSSLNPGHYRLQITGSVAEPDREFYLLDQIQNRDVFGVIELFADISTDNYRLVEHFTATPTLPVESVLRNQSYEIRFKNRVTFWRYLLQNGSPLMSGTQSVQPRRPLTKRYSQFTLGTRQLPDPSVDLIYPERNTSNPELVEAIFSEIYLNE